MRCWEVDEAKMEMLGCVVDTGELQIAWSQAVLNQSNGIRRQRRRRRRATCRNSLPIFFLGFPFADFSAHSGRDLLYPYNPASMRSLPLLAALAFGSSSRRLHLLSPFCHANVK